MLLGKRHWSTELLLESLWLKVSTNSNDLLQMKKYHIWGKNIIFIYFINYKNKPYLIIHQQN